MTGGSAFWLSFRGTFESDDHQIEGGDSFVMTNKTPG
jgi:hypothetical protein